MIYAFEKDRIYFATNSRDLEYSLYHQYYYSNPTEENLPFWHPHEGVLIYVDSNNARITDLIRYCSPIPKEISYETVEKFYANVMETLNKNGFENNEAIKFYLVIANSTDVYNFNGNGVISREDKKLAISGGNSNIAITVPAELPSIEKIKCYYRNLNRYFHRQNSPLLIMNTAEVGVRIVELD